LTLKIAVLITDLMPKLDRNIGRLRGFYSAETSHAAKLITIVLGQNLEKEEGLEKSCQTLTASDISWLLGPDSYRE
jgi:hypothetical protein